jgi:hypothetical protein
MDRKIPNGTSHIYLNPRIRQGFSLGELFMELFAFTSMLESGRVISLLRNIYDSGYGKMRLYSRN